MGNTGSTPPFSLDKPKYDMQTFWGRHAQLMDTTDFRTLLTSSTQLENAKLLLKQFETNTVPEGVTDEQLWQARKVKEAIVHPDTNEEIFAPFRFSAFAVVNVPVMVGLLLPNPGIGAVMFWQWVNQSYNVAVNYANRNASNPLTTEQIATAYVGACGTSVGIAVGLGEAVKRASSLSPRAAGLIRATVPFLAVASAGVMNVFLIRKNELSEGVDLFDEDGKVYGKSKNAAFMGLSECGAARVIWNAPLMLLPGMFMSQVDKLSVMKSNPRLRWVTNLSVITFTLWSSVPLAQAVFPQTETISAEKVEPEFQQLTNARGPISKFYFNKGL
eukprot:GFYU01006287.1.p1 GENE.GFYU01006287.1~~GFYU01006287.1.p1  ORF type:complete len:330 (+),score=76.00 GFYU01006287.1:82-1071(+)